MHRIRRTLVATAIAAATVTPIGLTATAAPAAAHCAPYASSMYASYGQEVAINTATCDDDDGAYHGLAYDSVTDGHCLTVWYKNPGDLGNGWRQGQGCSTGIGTSYWAYGSAYAIRVCKGMTSTCSVWGGHFDF